jgi:membrane-associated phospholipid phosphatase
MNEVVRFLLIFGICFSVMISHVHAQSEIQPDRQLKILEPVDEIQDLDPAFEMIMEKIDGDLRHILSSPVRRTPKGTAITGLTLLGTLFLLNEDDEYLSDIANTGSGNSDDVLHRLRVLGHNVPSTTAGLYLLGYFFDSKTLKSSSLESLEAAAIPALITAGSGYVIGHKGPQDSSNSDKFEPFNKYRSMPDMNSSLIFSMASVYAYETPFLETLLYYGIAAGTVYSRLYFQQAWPSDVFLGSILGTAIGRTVAARSRNGGESNFSMVPVLEHNGKAAIGLKVEFKL